MTPRKRLNGRAVRGRAGAVSGLRAAASVYNGAGTRAHGDEVTEVTLTAARLGPSGGTAGLQRPLGRPGGRARPGGGGRPALGATELFPWGPALLAGRAAPPRPGSRMRPEARSLKTKTKQPAPQNQRRSQKNTFFSFLDPL